METNKKKKLIINIISFISTFVLLGILLGKYLFVYVYALTYNNIVLQLPYTINIAILVVIIIAIINVYIIFKYIKFAINLFLKKKKIFSVILFTIMLIIYGFCLYLTKDAGSYLLQLSLSVFFITETLIIPMAFLAICAYNMVNNKKAITIIFTVIASIILVGTYIVSIPYIYPNLQNIGNILSSNSIVELFKSNTEKIEVDKQKQIKLKFSEYINRQEKRGYLYNNEVKMEILETISLSKNINVKYIDEKNNISIEVNSSENDWKSKIKEQITGDFLKISYEYDENYNVKGVTITKITGKEYTNNNEKNTNIKFDENSSIDSSLITNVRNDNSTENSINYVFENTLNTSNPQDTELSEFNMCLVYNDNSHNFELVGGHTDGYDKIQSYKVYSTGIEITLKNNVKLNKKYYTMRINRYDSKFNIIRTSDYFYLFEPVVTEMIDYEGRTVLEMKFSQITYQLQQLKNIEIMFGNM